MFWKFWAIHLSTQSLQCLQQYATKIDRFQDLKRPKIGPCQENDFFAKKTTQDLAGASPAVCTLPMVPCGSSPVTRFELASAKNEAPEEEADFLVSISQYVYNKYVSGHYT